jgi:hypothetical protein
VRGTNQHVMLKDEVTRAPDLPRRHPSRLRREDFVIKAAESILPVVTILGSNVDCRSRGVSSSNSPKFPFRFLRFTPLRVLPLLCPRWNHVSVFQMIGQLCLQPLAPAPLLKFFGQPVLADHVFRLLAVGQQLSMMVLSIAIGP